MQWRAVGVACFSFVLWIYVNGGGLLGVDDWLHFLREFDGKFGAVAVGLWTFIIPWFYKGET